MKIELFNWLDDNRDKFDPSIFCLIQNQASILFYLFDSMQKKHIKDFKKGLECNDLKGDKVST